MAGVLTSYGFNRTIARHKFSNDYFLETTSLSRKTSDTSLPQLTPRVIQTLREQFDKRPREDSFDFERLDRLDRPCHRKISSQSLPSLFNNPLKPPPVSQEIRIKSKLIFEQEKLLINSKSKSKRNSQSSKKKNNNYYTSSKTFTQRPHSKTLPDLLPDSYKYHRNSIHSPYFDKLDNKNKKHKNMGGVLNSDKSKSKSKSKTNNNRYNHHSNKYSKLHNSKKKKKYKGMRCVGDDASSSSIDDYSKCKTPSVSIPTELLNNTTNISLPNKKPPPRVNIIPRHEYPSKIKIKSRNGRREAYLCSNDDHSLSSLPDEPSISLSYEHNNNNLSFNHFKKTKLRNKQQNRNGNRNRNRKNMARKETEKTPEPPEVVYFTSPPLIPPSFKNYLAPKPKSITRVLS